MTFRAAALAITLLAVGVAQAAQTPGPFGLYFGMTAAQAIAMGAKRDSSIPNAYFLKTPPKGNGAFVSYILFISPSHGLCTATGTGRGINNDADGSRTRYAFAGLRATLTSIYGRPTSTEDALGAGSTYTSKNDWLIANLFGERHYTTSWDVSEHAKLPAGYGRIDLYVSPTDRSTGAVALSYRTRDARCMDDIRNSDKTGL